MVIFLCDSREEFDIENIMRLSEIFINYEDTFIYTIGYSHYNQLVSSIINSNKLKAINPVFIYNNCEGNTLNTDYSTSLVRDCIVKGDHIFVVRNDSIINEDDIKATLKRDISCVAAITSEEYRENDILLYCSDNRRINKVTVGRDDPSEFYDFKVCKGMYYLRCSLSPAFKLTITTYRNYLSENKINADSRTFILSRIIKRNLGVYPLEI